MTTGIFAAAIFLLTRLSCLVFCFAFDPLRGEWLAPRAKAYKIKAAQRIER
jgi:hypothetical protein